MRETRPSQIALIAAPASAAVVSTVVAAAISFAAPPSAPAEEAIKFSWWFFIAEVGKLLLTSRVPECFVLTLSFLNCVLAIVLIHENLA